MLFNYIKENVMCCVCSKLQCVYFYFLNFDNFKDVMYYDYLSLFNDFYILCKVSILFDVYVNYYDVCDWDNYVNILFINLCERIQ